MTHARLTAGLMIGLGLVAAGAASAQAYDTRQADGYCYAKQKDAKSEGALTGAIIGGLLGSQVSKNERGLGAVTGAVIGGAVGSNAGKSSVKCYNGEYYAYQGSYYQPPRPPAGYTTVYYQSRPDQSHYSHVYYDRYHHATPAPYGYQDAWRSGDNNPNGWYDDRGVWHDGNRNDNQQRRGHARGYQNRN